MPVTIKDRESRRGGESTASAERVRARIPQSELPGSIRDVIVTETRSCDHDASLSHEPHLVKSLA